MLTSINAKFADPRMPDIRNVVGLKTDEVPYALLPVRMETRFMQIEKPFFYKPVTFDEILEELKHLLVQTNNVINSMSFALIASLTTEMTDRAVTLVGMNVSNQERDVFKSMLPPIQSAVAELISKAPASLASVAQEVNTAYSKLASVVSGTSTLPGDTFTGVGNNLRNQLWVRIFPDDLFVKTHEPNLTDDETGSGKNFWKLWWAASGNHDLEMAAWNTLCSASGATRASWIARELNPSRLDSVKNSTALNAKPSSVIVAASGEINNAYNALKLVPTENTSAHFLQYIRSNPTLGNIPGSLGKMITTLTNIKAEQDYLLENFKTAFIKVASCINNFQAKIAGLDRAQTEAFAAEIAIIKSLAEKIASIRILLDAIRPVEYQAFSKALPEPFDYPAVGSKQRDWNNAPYTDCLPTRFVIAGIKLDSFTQLNPQAKYLSVGNPVSTNLQLGLDPAKFENASAFQIDSNGNMVVEEGIRWMTDYQEAVKKGMAITMELTAQDFNQGLDSLIVLGIRDADANSSKALLQNLFTNHIYSADGMSFLKVGTATNNTEHKKSFLSSNNDVQQRYDIEIANKKFNAAETNKLNMSDGKWLTDALGLDANVLQFANNNNNLETANALAMNRALWHAGPGHFLQEMGDRVFTYDNIYRVEDYYTNYCFGRGMLPSLQIGEQPYGVMVTTAFSTLKLYDTLPGLTYTEMLGVSINTPPSPALEARLQQRFEMRLQQMLKLLNDVIWQSLRTAHVVHSTTSFNGDQQQKFMKMLGLHATSLDYFYRYSLNTAEAGANTGNSNVFGPEGIFGLFKDMMSKGIFYPSFNFIDERPEFKVGKTDFEIQQAQMGRILNQFYDTRLYNGRLMSDTHPIPNNIIDDKLLSTENGTDNTPGYFDWLLQSAVKELLADNDTKNPAKMPSHSLLFLMLRQSLLQAYQEAALQVLHKENILNEEYRRKIGSSNFEYFSGLFFPDLKANSMTKWPLLFSNLADLKDSIAFPSPPANNPFFNFMIQTIPGIKSMDNYLDPVRDPAHLPGKLFRASHVADFNKLVKVREAIQTLKRVSAADLEILFAEQMDMSAYRLDAWVLGMANRRLMQQRGKTASGIFLGAYGYVENLRPAKKKAVTDASKLQGFSLEPLKPVYHDSENQGFIHAPSINQAITAAVLRSAYQASKSQEAVHNRLAVNISSARVRMALNLMEGIRNGQEMGAILGFQFERGLHERYQQVELDKFIQPFRKAFPLNQPVETAPASNPSYASQVVNGTDMLQLVFDNIQWLDFPSGDTLAALLKKDNYKALPVKIRNTILGALQTGDDSNKIFDVIIEEIDRMADTFDSLGDLAISESVYQVVQGNHVRAAAVLAALAQGKNIPDPQVIETNRTGTVVTHRVLLNFSPAANSLVVPAGWNSNGSFRSFTEPSFNNWLGTVLGNPQLIKCVITTTDRNNIVHKENFTLGDLGWQPLDLFAVPGAENELKDIIRNVYIIKNKLFTVPVTINFDEKGADWNANDKTIAEIFLQLNNLKNMLSNARPASAVEFMLPDADMAEQNPGNHDIAEFDKRIKAAYKALQTLNTMIAAEPYVATVLNGTTAVEKVIPATGNFESIIDHLGNAALTGIPNALSLSFDINNNDQQRFTASLQHLLNIYKESLARENNGAGIITAIDGSDDATIKLEKLGELAKLIFGKTFSAIPLYKPVNANDIVSQLKLPDAQQLTRNEGPFSTDNWLQGIGKVRKRMYDVAMARQVQDIQDVPVTSLQPVQFPFTAGDYWLGIEYPVTYKPGGDKLSLVLLNEQVFAAQPAQCGFIIDEWLEIIPGKEETTGISFYYNQPNSTAPQSILLAVSPNNNNKWQWEDLLQTIMDTVELAKNRAVEPEHVDLSDWNHVLPGIVAEVAAPHDDVQTNPLNIKAVMDFSNVENKN